MAIIEIKVPDIGDFDEVTVIELMVKPGDTIKLTIFRFDKLREVAFKLGSNNRKEYSFGVISEPTDLQKKLYRDYLNADL